MFISESVLDIVASPAFLYPRPDKLVILKAGSNSKSGEWKVTKFVEIVNLSSSKSPCISTDLILEGFPAVDM